MKKYIKTTAKNAIKKGLIKEGDKVWVDCTIINIDNNIITIHSHGKNIQLPENRTIRIPKPEPKPIDFGVAGRVLKYTGQMFESIFITTGRMYGEENGDDYFFGYKPDDGWAGEVLIGSDLSKWTDITDTYKP